MKTPAKSPLPKKPTIRHRKVVRAIGDLLLEASHAPGADPLDAVMAACDISAHVLLGSFTEAEQLDALKVFYVRLGDIMEHEAARKHQ